MGMCEFLFVVSLFFFYLVKIHFLVCFLFMEIMSICVFFLMLSNFSEGFLILVYLCMMVLEAAFGLSMIVSQSRKKGGDFSQVIF